MNMQNKLEETGYWIIQKYLEREQIEYLQLLTSRLDTLPEIKRRRESVYGVRDLMRYLPELREFIANSKLAALAQELTGKSAKMVRAIYFDKTTEANWKVAWHQDATIAVQERLPAAGFDVWSVKAGIPHVQPPVFIMERMVTLRLHLDACDENNGALRILPTTHRQGRLLEGQIAGYTSNPSVLCSLPAGGLLVMKPLLLHASSAGRYPSRRRVLHFEFSPDTLPDGLKWYDAV